MTSRQHLQYAETWFLSNNQSQKELYCQECLQTWDIRLGVSIMHALLIFIPAAERYTFTRSTSPFTRPLTWTRIMFIIRVNNFRIECIYYSFINPLIIYTLTGFHSSVTQPLASLIWIFRFTALEVNDLENILHTVYFDHSTKVFDWLYLYLLLSISSISLSNTVLVQTLAQVHINGNIHFINNFEKLFFIE